MYLNQRFTLFLFDTDKRKFSTAKLPMDHLILSQAIK